MPENGWDDATIEYLLSQLAMMDSNNFASNVGVGEREARIFSNLVSKRMFNLGHGITPEVNPDHVSAFVDAVHELSSQYHA